MIPKAEPRIETDLFHLLEQGSLLKKKGLTDKDKETLFLTERAEVDDLKQVKYVCLLFSAQWCAPCHSFIQLLKEFYAEANLDERQCEIVYLPMDRSQQEFEDHYATMPWLSFTPGDPRIAMLKKQFHITGIPVMIVLEA